MVGAVLVGAVILVAVAAPHLAPYDPQAIVGSSLERPSADHVLGTTDVGQDIASRSSGERGPRWWWLRAPRRWSWPSA